MRWAILLNRQGFPALQPHFEINSHALSQPGCDNFPCISCTSIDDPGIKCCGNSFWRPMPSGFELFIRRVIGKDLMHKHGASNDGRIELMLLNRGTINKMARKIYAGKSKKRCGGPLRPSISSDVTPFNF